jgi:hypothetical protein
MLIAFYTPNINFRGSCVALRDYALYNEILLHNRSIIISDYNQKHTNDEIAFSWLSRRFPIFFSRSLQDLDDILIREQCDILYCIKYGIDDGIYSTRIKTAIHCVFDMSQPHGNVFAGVSKSLADKFNCDTFVPHMISLIPTNGENLRREFSIPNDANVFGRHGGIDTFNLEFTKIIISKIVRESSNIYFVFMNAPVWDNHPQIIYLPATTDIDEKKKFIRTCDAMIVPETMGHTFGLSIAEFSVYNKPVICYNGPVWNTSHIDILGDKGIYFKTADELYNILNNFESKDYNNVDINAYRDYTPENVMRKFKDIQEYSIYIIILNFYLFLFYCLINKYVKLL